MNDTGSSYSSGNHDTSAYWTSVGNSQSSSSTPSYESSSTTSYSTEGNLTDRGYSSSTDGYNPSSSSSYNPDDGGGTIYTENGGYNGDVNPGSQSSNQTTNYSTEGNLTDRGYSSSTDGYNPSSSSSYNPDDGGGTIYTENGGYNGDVNPSSQSSDQTTDYSTEGNLTDRGYSSSMEGYNKSSSSNYNPDDGGGTIHTENGGYNGNVNPSSQSSDQTTDEFANYNPETSSNNNIDDNMENISSEAERRREAALALAAIHESNRIIKNNQEKMLAEFMNDRVNGISIISNNGAYTDGMDLFQDSVEGIPAESIENAKEATQKDIEDSTKLAEDIKKFQNEYGDLGIATEELELLYDETKKHIDKAEETENSLNKMQIKLEEINADFATLFLEEESMTPDEPSTPWKPSKSNDYFDQNRALDGKYGADQGALDNIFSEHFDAYDRLREKLIAEYNIDPSITDFIFNYMDNGEYNGGACPTANSANVVFAEYADKPEEFEETFGFSMYVDDGNGNQVLNVEELMIDMFIWTNSEDPDGRNGLIPNEEGKYVTNPEIKCANFPVFELAEYLATKNENTEVEVEADFANRNAYNTNESNLIYNGVNQNGEGATEISYEEMKEDISTRINNGENLSVVLLGTDDPINFINADTNELLTPMYNAHHWVKVTDANSEGIIVSSWGYKAFISYSDLTAGDNGFVFFSTHFN